MKSYEFPHKGEMSINIKSEEDKIKILDFLKQDDNFEFGYLNKDCINIINTDKFYHPEKLTHLTNYNGKYDGNIKGLLKFASDNNIEMSIICKSDEEYIEIYYNFNYNRIKGEIDEIINSNSETKTDDILNLIEKFFK